METDAPKSAGFLDALLSFGDNVLAGVQNRLELFSLELQEERLRLVRTLVWVCAVVFAGMMAVAFASLTIVVFFWETARLTALAAATGLYAAALLGLALGLRRYLKRQPRPFAATLHELREDRACMPGGS